MIFGYLALLLISAIVSKFLFVDDLPRARAAKTIAVSAVLSFGLSAFVTFLMGRDVGALLDPVSLGIFAIVALLAFLWEWWSFKRHWLPDEDPAEVFE